MNSDELIERLEKAAASLDALADLSLQEANNAAYADVHIYVQNAQRLKAKAEGVRLALSYTREMSRGRERFEK